MESTRLAAVLASAALTAGGGLLGYQQHQHEAAQEERRTYNHFLGVLDGSETAAPGDPATQLAADARSAWVTGDAPDTNPLRGTDPVTHDLPSRLYPGVVEATGKKLLSGKSTDFEPAQGKMMSDGCTSCGAPTPELLRLVEAAREGSLEAYQDEETPEAPLNEGNVLLLGLGAALAAAGAKTKELKKQARALKAGRKRRPAALTPSLQTEIEESQRRLENLAGLTQTPLVAKLRAEEEDLLHQLQTIPHLIQARRDEAAALTLCSARPDAQELAGAQRGADETVKQLGGNL